MGGRKRRGQCSVWSNVFVFLTVGVGFPLSSVYADFMRSIFYSQVERLISVVTKKKETLSVSCKAAMKATMTVTTK